MRYLIRTTQRADADLDSTVSWLRRHISPATATRWQARVIKRIHSLVTNPERCPEADEAADLGIDLRVLLSGRRPHVYRILFTIDGRTVNVLRVLHAARDRVEPGDL